MSPRRIGRHVGGGPEPEEERTRRERADSLREAYSRWASGVGILAVRAQGRVHALTVSAFVPVSLEPPLILVSLGGNAAALPYLDPDAAFALSLLSTDQRGLASRFADTFPVGDSPFPDSGPPVVQDALASLVCRVDELLERGDHTLVLGRVDDAAAGGEDPPLIYFRRSYHSIS